MSLNQRVTAEFSTCTPSAPPTADLSIQTIRTRSWNTRRATLSSGLSPQPPRRNQLPHRSSTNAAAKPGARPEQAKIGGLFSTYVLPTQKRKSLGARANLTWAARNRCKKDISKPARKGVRCWP
jgi:hypothetical protein